MRNKNRNKKYIPDFLGYTPDLQKRTSIHSLRIHVWNIYQPVGIIYQITLGVNVGKYSSTMDPLG
jgi:hypothetical protein